MAPTSLPPRGAVYAGMRSYMLAGGACCALAATTDWLLGGGLVDGIRMLPAVVGLGAFAGLLMGVLVGLALGVSWLLPDRVRLPFAVLVAATWTYATARELGAFARWSGPYSTLAVTSVLGLAGLAAATVAAFVLARPMLASDPPRFSTRIAERGAAARRSFAAGAVLVLVAAVVVDRGFFPTEYPVLREVLRRGALLAATIGVGALVVGRWHASRKQSAYALGAAAIVAAYPFAMLDGLDTPALSAMLARPFTSVAVTDARFFGDFDADGYSQWLGGGDCAPFDGRVHPGRRELRRNGIDDNCRLGDNPAPEPKRSSLGAARGAPASSLALITVDALRADHVGAYGYRRPTTPNIDAWFRDGARFEQAFAPGSDSALSLPALMYGVQARRLRYAVMMQTRSRLVHAGASHEIMKRGEKVIATRWLAFDGPHPTVAALLRQHGMRTAAFVDDGMSGVVAAPLVGAGFESFTSVVPSASQPNGDPIVVTRALRWLEALRRDQPFFLWVHLHGKQAAARHGATAWFGSGVVDRYDHEVAYIDEQLKPLLTALSDLEHEQPLTTVLTANHGEGFYPTGRAHGVRLSEDELRVPLLMRGHRAPSGAQAQLVSVLDVTATLLELAGAPTPSRLDGHSLLRPPPGRRVVLADSWSYSPHGELRADRVAAISEQRRFVFEPTSNMQQLFARGEATRSLRAHDAALEHAVYAYLEEEPPVPELLMLRLSRASRFFADEQ